MPCHLSLASSRLSFIARLDPLALLGIIQPIRILIEDDISMVTDVLTHPGTPPSRQKYICIIMLIMITHNLFNRLCRLTTIIKGDATAKVVCYVSLIY